MGNFFFEVIWLSCQSERLRTLAIKRGSLATAVAASSNGRLISLTSGYSVLFTKWFEWHASGAFIAMWGSFFRVGHQSWFLLSSKPSACSLVCVGRPFLQLSYSIYDSALRAVTSSYPKPQWMNLSSHSHRCCPSRSGDLGLRVLYQ